MVACRITLLALLSCFLPTTGAVFRHAGSIVGAKKAENEEEVQRVAGLLDVEKDLETDRKKDDVSLHELESQIVALVHKRDAAKRDEARKDKEIAFLQSQIGRRAHSEASAVVAQEAQQENKAQAVTNVDAAIASADQVVKQAEASESEVSARRSQEQAAAQAAAEAAAQQRAQEEAAASAAAAATARAEARRAAEAQKAAAKRKAEAEESREAFEARIRQEAEEKARMKIQAEQEAESRLRAEAEAKAKAKLEAEEKVKREAAQAKQEAEEKQAEEERKKKEALADSADDSFKQFMKEEDGEDQMGDADYEDSANALAGAIGWNRNEIEKKADSAVKQLTEAIGGKKVVQSLQGMMAGVHR